MLKVLKINNFRCFSFHTIEFGALNIAVGVNNAGKTTVAEALRIISIVTQRYYNISAYKQPPGWLFVPRRLIGFNVSLKNLEINFNTLIHRYGEPPAMIEADFGSHGRIRIYIGGENRVHCVLYNGKGVIAKNRQAARNIKIPIIETLPQVAPVLAEEKILVPDYVKGALSSRLAPLHFRNQLNLLYKYFNDFRQAVEDTWPGLQIKELIGHGKNPGEILHLHIRDGDFVSEVSLMGHGLQMWLQTVWFLIRAKNADTVILDEPDVYMHADLQRRLIRFVRSRFPQVIVTSHSTEIMSEVAPENIIVVDKTQSQSKSADSLPAVQRVLSGIGSAHNIHLARLWSAKRFLLVEGDDLKLLQIFQNILMPNSPIPIYGLPHASIGGWGGWRYALGSSLALKNAAGYEIKTYCILDSDYHSLEQVIDLHDQFQKRGVNLHIWQLKEIENYLLVPDAIHRAIITNIPKRSSQPSVEEIEIMIETFAKELKEELFDGVAQEILSTERSLGVAGANKKARRLIKSKIDCYGIRGVVSGKQVLKKLFNWTQSEFGVSLTKNAVAQHIKANEISNELKTILFAIENLSNFEPQEFNGWI